MSLRFGIVGVPRTSARPLTEHGIRRVRELGLDCMEMGWVNGVRMNDATADRIARAAREHGVALTAHAPYFVNLCGNRAIVARSVRRLLDTGRLAARCGAHSFCFHAGFYQLQKPARARHRVASQLKRVARRLRAERVPVDIRPELTGRRSQLGSLEELLRWSRGIAGVAPCIDFAHHVARHAGAHRRYDDFMALLMRIEARLGRAALERLHVHMTGIEYGPSGERRHVPLRDSMFDHRDVLRALKDARVSGWVVCESPGREDDALILQRAYRRMR